MNASNKRRLITIIIVIVTLVIVTIVGSATNSFNLPTKSKPMSSTIVEEKQLLASNTVKTFFTVLLDDVSEQIGEKQASTILITPDTDNQDSKGKKATVAIIAATGIADEFNYETNGEALKTLVDEIKTSTTQPWVYVQSNDAEFEGSEVLTAFKIFEETDKPDNPAITEVSYVKNTSENGIITYEIYFSSTVY